MTAKEQKEMDGLYERVHELEKELVKAWTADELFRMLDCMKAPYVDKQNTDLFSQGVMERRNLLSMGIRESHGR